MAKSRGGREFALLAFSVSFFFHMRERFGGENLTTPRPQGNSSLIHQDWNMSVSKQDQLQKIINLWPIWKKGNEVVICLRRAHFQSGHFWLPASFSRHAVKLPFLLVLIERHPPPLPHPRSLPTPSCVAHLSLFVGSQCGCPFHWLWESTSSYLFVPWHGNDALDQAGHLEAGYRSRTALLYHLCVTQRGGFVKGLHTEVICHL